MGNGLQKGVKIFFRGATIIEHNKEFMVRKTEMLC